MACYHPIAAWRAPKFAGGISFKRSDSFGIPLELPCGQCIGCRIRKRKEWSLRIMHEAQMHKENCFVTLTYNEDFKPCDNSLHVEHFQKFMKRLRKKFQDRTLRFYHCGEYGKKLNRPHYHACLFGVDFHDKQLLSEKGDYRLYTSETLSTLWGMGYCTITVLNEATAAYCANYATKKMTGEQAQKHYEIVDAETGEIFKLVPEYATMSRRPGIGKSWYEKYKTDLYPSDNVIDHKGRPNPVPGYYDRLLEKEDPQALKKLKKARRKRAKAHKENQTWERLEVREQVAKLNQQARKRTYED